MTRNGFIHHFLFQNSGVHIHHWFLVRIFHLLYIDIRYLPNLFRHRRPDFRPLNFVMKWSFCTSSLNLVIDVWDCDWWVSFGICAFYADYLDITMINRDGWCLSMESSMLIPSHLVLFNRIYLNHIVSVYSRTPIYYRSLQTPSRQPKADWWVTVLSINRNIQKSNANELKFTPWHERVSTLTYIIIR